MNEVKLELFCSDSRRKPNLNHRVIMIDE